MTAIPHKYVSERAIAVAKILKKLKNSLIHDSPWPEE
jgi:hypothetical protein